MKGFGSGGGGGKKANRSLIWLAWLLSTAGFGVLLGGIASAQKVTVAVWIELAASSSHRQRIAQLLAQRRAAPAPLRHTAVHAAQHTSLHPPSPRQACGGNPVFNSANVSAGLAVVGLEQCRTDAPGCHCRRAHSARPHTHASQRRAPHRTLPGWPFLPPAGAQVGYLAPVSCDHFLQYAWWVSRRSRLGAHTPDPDAARAGHLCSLLCAALAWPAS